MRALIIPNPRVTGGSTYRVESWKSIFAEMGYEVEVLPARFDSLRPWHSLAQVRRVVAKTAVPESIVFHSRALVADIVDRSPDVVVLQTLRVFSPALLDEIECPVILDYVDQLSSSYGQRASASGGLSKVLYAALSHTHRSTERHVGERANITTAAGIVDAENLRAVWLPNTVDPSAFRAFDGTRKEFDVTFFGSLNYPPNVEALEWFAQAMDVDTLSVLIAGRTPTDLVRELCARHGWTLEEDFPDVGWLAERATVAIVPLLTTNGIQCKILDSAMAGIPMVCTSTAMRGFDRKFPTVVDDDPNSYVGRINALLEDDELRRQLARRAQDHVLSEYVPERWVGVVRELVDPRLTSRV